MTNTNKIPIPELARQFPGLTLAQYRLLCFCACYGAEPELSIWWPDFYDSKFGIRKGRTKKDREELYANGYLVRNNNPVPARNYFSITLGQIKHYPEWNLIFEELSRYSKDHNRYLWQMSKCLALKDWEKAAELKYPVSVINLWRYFKPIALLPEYENVLPLIPIKDRQEMLRSIIDSGFKNESLTIDDIARVKELSVLYLPDDSAMRDICDMYHFFLTGEIRESGTSVWSYGVRATGELIKGNLDDAFKIFRDGLGDSPVYGNGILGWFHLLCLLAYKDRYESSTAGESIEKLRGSDTCRYVSEYAPVRILLSYREAEFSHRRDNVIGEISKLIEKKSPVVTLHFARMLMKYFSIPDETFPQLSQETLGIPKALIVRNEVAPYIAMASTERQKLDGIFHGGSLIGKLACKEDWELALSEVTELRPDVKEEPLRQRIIYFLNDGRLSAVIEQTQSPDGEWKREKEIGRAALIKNQYPLADRTDQIIASRLGSKMIGVPDAEIILPLLAGSDRLYTGQHLVKPFAPLLVREDSPAIDFSAADGRIVVRTNVGRTDSGGYSGFSGAAEPDGTYVFIRTNPVQREIIGKLMQIGNFPQSAVGAVRKTAESLRGLITVSMHLEGLVPIPAIPGGTRIALRLIPSKGNTDYDLTVLAAPDEDGSLRYDPGQGSPEVFEGGGESARIIARDLQTEYDNYMEFRTFAEDELNLEFLSSTHTEIASTSSLLAIVTWAADHRDKCFVEWPEGRALRFRGTVQKGAVDITVRSNVNWFEMEGEVKLDDKTLTLEELLAAMKASDVEGFIKLSDKDYARMSATLKKHLQDLDRMICGRRGRRLTVPVYRVGHLAEVLGTEGGLNATMDEGFKNMLRRMQESYDTMPEIPKTLNGTLRDYQKDGYRWMMRLSSWGAGACLADDMGLGKTVQAIAVLLSKASCGPSLVVAPKSVIPNWDLELARFAPALRVKILNNENNRSACISGAGAGDVILLTYGVLGTRAASLASRKWNVVCLDEAHQIKNRNTRVSAAAMGLQAENRIILTGTPLQNHLGELWNLFQFINPGLLGPWKDFRSRYMQSELDDSHKQFLKELVQPFILRRTKQDVLSDLPEKIVYEQYVKLTEDEAELYEKQREYVRKHIKSALKEGEAKEKDGVTVSFFAELTNLRLAACSMSLVYEEWRATSSKTEALKELLERIRLSGEENRILLFSQFTSYLSQVKLMLDREGLRYLYMDGQTSLEERKELVAKFQGGESPIFISSLKAGGLGLNLTAANYVILLDPWWNPSIEEQAMDRAHRIGQKRSVTVIRLVSRHTIEEKILRLHETKRALSDELLEGTGDSYRLTMDDVLDMVSPYR